MSESAVLLETVDGIATITLNRPEKRNAINSALLTGLKDALTATAADESVRVVAITGAGKDFCSGLDLSELEKISAMSEEENLADARGLADLFEQMRAHPRPVVALVRGRALAGGCGLASACDMILAEEGAKLGYPEVRIGFVPALVMNMLRRKVGESVAFELAVLGRRIDAERAASVGLVSRVFSESDFEAESAALLADLASLPPGAVATTKALLYELDGMGFEDGLERASAVNAKARMTDECRAGVRAFLEKR